MKIALIHPPSREVYKEFQRKPIYRLPIGLAYIAAVAQNQSHEVLVLDAEADGLSDHDIANRLSAFQPDAVAITCTTPIFPVAVRILELSKKIAPGIPTIMGGQHVSALPRESLEFPSAIDYVIFGEGEITFAELLAALAGKNCAPAIPGLAFRKGGSIILNPTRNLEKDLDCFPFPARELFPLDKYRDPDRYEEPYTLMVTSRGCPYRCIFCGSAAVWGKKVRFRSAENVLAEVDEVVNRFGINRITFCDDTFTLERQRVIAICRGLAERNYRLTFCTSSRVNTVDEDGEMLQWLARAGCQELSFGVESADENILKVLRKEIDLERVKPTFALVKSFGIRVHSSFIIGNPGDSHQTIRKTVDFAKSCGTDAAQFSIATPFPGTEMWDIACKRGLIRGQDFSQFKWYYSVVANLSEVSDGDLIRYQRQAYQEFQSTKR